mmetsp:Transcript_27332/g.70317  ORF Transcript_27332/g.70317 Transcript_27332/m.70317 type:complete len:218 (-) Transcript_27332:262-915(-)
MRLFSFGEGPPSIFFFFFSILFLISSSLLSPLLPFITTVGEVGGWGESMLAAVDVAAAVDARGGEGAGEGEGEEEEEGMSGVAAKKGGGGVSEKRGRETEIDSSRQLRYAQSKARRGMDEGKSSEKGRGEERGRRSRLSLAKAEEKRGAESATTDGGEDGGEEEGEKGRGNGKKEVESSEQRRRGATRGRDIGGGERQGEPSPLPSLDSFKLKKRKK